MKLLTKEIRAKLPPLYSNDGKGDEAMAVVKFFDPCGSWTWYATEGSYICPNHGCYDCTDPSCGDPATWNDFMFFGLVDGIERELGYFSLREMQEFHGRFGLGIERDRGWLPQPLREIKGRSA